MSRLPKPCKVLVIDDDIDSAELMQILLQMEGFVVQKALSGAAGLSQLPAFSPQVVCLDIEIHDYLIEALISEIKSCPGLPTPLLIGMTSWDEADHPDLNARRHFDFSYTKPVPIHELVAEIRRFCHR